jgi:hypothetical protein
LWFLLVSKHEIAAKKGVISRMSLKFRNNCWQSYMRFQNVSSSSTSSTVRNAAPIAWTQKGTTLKITTMTNNKGKHTFCYWLSPGLFDMPSYIII